MYNIYIISMCVFCIAAFICVMRHLQKHLQSNSCQEGLNPKTGEISKSLRSRIEQVPGNVLRLAAEGQLFPAEPGEV